ncbi:hypothetical protein Tco_1220430 [Tanacetum coccineum]
MYSQARDSPFDLEAFSDSIYAGASLDKRSTTGGCQFLGKRLISWQCKKQTIVANSTTEAEYVSAANCCGYNPVFHSKTKHLEIRHHFIKDSYEKKLIQVIKIHTDYNVVDLLTKAFDIMDFLISSTVHYALTVSPTIYASDIEQFWNTATSYTVNDVKHIYTTVDRKAVVVIEASVRSSLLFNDVDGTACLTNEAIFQNLALMGKGQKFLGRVTPLFPGMLAQQAVAEGEANEAVHQELGDRMVRAAITASLDAQHVSGNTFKTQSMATLNEPNPQGERSDPPLSIVNTVGSEEDSMEPDNNLMVNVPPTPHDSPLSGGNTLGSDEGRMELIQELMKTCTSLTKRVLALEEAKTAQDKVITRLKLRVRRLEKKRKART